jgi:integrase
LVLVDGSTNGKLYETVLNSFNAAFPGVAIEAITKSDANAYMSALLKTNKPNGVHTYMRTLNAIFNKVKPLHLPNPFEGVRPKKEQTKSKHLNDAQLKKLFFTRTLLNKHDYKSSIDSINAYRYYFMLMFYLGGIDAIDLANLRYDEHVNDGRVQFYRFKGGTSVYINNKIFPEAEALLKRFGCYPYLVPIHKYKSQNDFVSNMNDRLNDYIKDLRLGVRVLTKGARYSFINRAQQMLIDERITMELVGHAQQSTHSIYTNEFPLSVRDAAHEKIISLL